jgi:hypothetical protein
MNTKEFETVDIEANQKKYIKIEYCDFGIIKTPITEKESMVIDACKKIQDSKKHTETRNVSFDNNIKIKHNISKNNIVSKKAINDNVTDIVSKIVIV